MIPQTESKAQARRPPSSLELEGYVLALKARRNLCHPVDVAHTVLWSSFFARFPPPTSIHIIMFTM